MTQGPSSVEEGIAAGFERAATFDLAPGPQGELFQAVTDVVAERPDADPRAVAYFSEALTVASAARAEHSQPPLRRDDVRLAFSFWEWLFDGLVRP
jgi:hypothetical protein